jgi:membrane protein YqaA with SNARE-associated domain
MIKSMYNWIINKAGHPHAKWYLFGISFTESSISPFPPDPLMVPMVIKNKDKAWHYAWLTTLASVTGGMVGYAIGFYLFQKIGIPVLKAYGLMDKLEIFQNSFYKWGFWAIVIKAFTPIPFKLVTITCGALQFSFWKFILASTISRGIRFYLLAGILYKYGPKMHDLIERNIMLVSTLFIGLLVGGFFIVKYLF